MSTSPSRRSFLSAAVVSTGLSLVEAPAFAAEHGARARFVPPEPAGKSFAVMTPDGLQLSAKAYGDPADPEIVLVHGLGQSRLSWALQTSGLLAERFRVVTYDLRGHGDSDKPLSPSAYADGKLWGDDLAAVIAASGLRRPVLVGWSLGALAIGHYLAQHGNQKVAGINLVDAVTRLDPALLTPLAGEFAGKLGAGDLEVRNRAIEEFLQACFHQSPSEEALRWMLAFNGMVPRAVQLGILRISAEGLDEAFGAAGPTLVTYGAHDRLTRREMSERVLGLNPQARMSVYPDAGHSPFFEEPTRFNFELARFVDTAVAAKGGTL